MELSCYWLLLLVGAAISPTASPYSPFVFGPNYYDLYLKFEEALMKDQKILEGLRAGFLANDTTLVNFRVNITVNNIPEWTSGAFWPGPDGRWVLSPDCYLCMTFSQTYVSETELNESGRVDTIAPLIVVLSVMHGTMISIYIPRYPPFKSNYFSSEQNDLNTRVTLVLNISYLASNPPCYLVEAAVKQLVSWIKVYTSGEKPQTWDQSKKGAVTFDHYWECHEFYDETSDSNSEMDLNFMNLKMHTTNFLFLSITEYAVVSTSLALVIAKFFPGVHKQIVSGATSLELQSLYWGTAVVSNVFTYGLVFATMRSTSIFMRLYFYMQQVYLDLHWCIKYIIIIPPLQDAVVFLIFMFSSLIASLESHQGNVPIPRVIVKYLLYFFSCMCCCCCCSTVKREKILKVLVMLGFMNFIYHSLMDAISIAFLLFIAESRNSVVTFTLLYVSLVLFLMLLISYLLYTLFRSNFSISASGKFFTCCASTFIFIMVFAAVMLLVIMYMIIVFSLNLKGVSGIVTGLIPTVVLSAASWYIKKRLEKEMNRSNSKTPSQHQHQYGTTGGAMNDGGGEDTEEHSDDQTLLLP